MHASAIFPKKWTESNLAKSEFLMHSQVPVYKTDCAQYSVKTMLHTHFLTNLLGVSDSKERSCNLRKRCTS